MSINCQASTTPYDENETLSLVCHFCKINGLFTQEAFHKAWLPKTFSLHAGFTYMTSWKQIQSSADPSTDNCQWCKLILSARNEVVRNPVVQITVNFRSGSTKKNDSDSSLEVVTPRGVQSMRIVLNGDPHSVYYIYTKNNDPGAKYIVARNRITQVNSLSARTLASECIADCVRNHDQCRHPQSTPLPTRVIDCSDPAVPRLYSTSAERELYLVLSYVWGEQQPYCTTTKNLEEYTNAIKLALIPQTIKDAIFTTHAFGYRYLWVDAFCILQDSREDKSREIAKMRDIFRNAHVTIIAASSNKASDGFLQERPQDNPLDISLPFFCPDGEIGRMFLTPSWTQYDGSSEPVNQRAWCLEERLLSSRSLVYASHTLQFHCQSAVINIGKSICGLMFGHRLPDLLFLPDSEIPLMLSKKSRRMLKWAWLEVIGDFTRRDVTKPNDKLLTLAAVAEQFNRVWRSQYLAGLWQDSLHQDLLWYKDPEKLFPKPIKYRAPSWSWASVDGRVIAHTMEELIDMDMERHAQGIESCEIISCEVTLDTHLVPFGKVNAGLLVLRAVIQKAKWNPSAPTPELYLPYSELSRELSTEISQDHFVNDLLPIGFAYIDSNEGLAVEEVWAIPIRWNNAAHYAAGLIATRVDEEKYRRVGYFHSHENPVAGLNWIHQEKQVAVII